MYRAQRATFPRTKGTSPCHREDEEEYSDDEDLSWKVRRAAAKVLAAAISAYPDLVADIYAKARRSKGLAAQACGCSPCGSHQPGHQLSFSMALTWWLTSCLTFYMQASCIMPAPHVDCCRSFRARKWLIALATAGDVSPSAHGMFCKPGTSGTVNDCYGCAAAADAA